MTTRQTFIIGGLLLLAGVAADGSRAYLMHRANAAIQQGIAPLLTPHTVFALFAVGALLRVAGTLVLCWIMPYASSADTTFLSKRKPRKFWQGALVAIWLVPILVAISALGIGFMFLRLFGDNGLADLWHITTYGVVGLAGAIPFLIAWRLLKTIKRRLAETVRQIQVCYACGYDRRGKPEGACPECGYDGASGAG